MKFWHGISLRRSFAVGVMVLLMGLVLYRPGETEKVAPASQPLAVSTARADDICPFLDTRALFATIEAKRTLHHHGRKE